MFITVTRTLAVLALLVSLTSMPAMAQYDNWPAPRLLAEYRNMLVNMDSVVKALDKNIALAETLKKEKAQLDSQSAGLDAQAKALEQEGSKHNAEVATFNAQCIDVQVTDQATGDKCNQWSVQLNTRSEELSGRRTALSRQIEDLNARVSDFNARETARAREAADLDKRFDEYENNVRLIESRLASLEETRDISVRCKSYREPETRQKCMQQFWNDEH